MFQGSISVPQEGSTIREMVRNQICLPITLVHAGVEAAAEIWNLTGFGALVHSANVPPAGSRIRLTRGKRTVDGQVAWSNLDKFGVRFVTSISLRDWLKPHARNALGSAMSRAKPLRETDQSVEEPAARVMRDVLLVSQLIDELSAEIASDPTAAKQHLSKVQNLDVAVQMLTVVCWQLDGSYRANGGSKD